MTNASEILEQVANKRVIVVGDAMLDHYVTGQVHRMSRKRRSPLFLINRRIIASGGAANVALNLEGLNIKNEPNFRHWFR